MSERDAERYVAEHAQSAHADVAHAETATLPLLATSRLTPRARFQLAAARLSWIEELTGHIALSGPGLYVTTDVAIPVRQPAAGQNRRPTRLEGRSGRCAETLLLTSSREPVLTTRALAEEADVSLAMASYVLRRLEREGGVRALGTGRRDRRWEVTNPSLILDLWTAEERLDRSVDTLAYLWVRTPRDLYRKLAQLNRFHCAWAVGGVAAANLYAPTLTVDPLPDVWVSATTLIPQLIEEIDGQVVESGANVRFRQMADDPWSLHAEPFASTAPPLAAPTDARPSDTVPLHLISRPRAYVEATAAQVGRSAEVAAALRHVLQL